MGQSVGSLLGATYIRAAAGCQSLASLFPDQADLRPLGICISDTNAQFAGKFPQPFLISIGNGRFRLRPLREQLAQEPKRQPGGVGLPFWFLTNGGEMGSPAVARGGLLLVKHC